ncbi:MAG: AAA family ATPase [Syntrophobacteraceae bacterium]
MPLIVISRGSERHGEEVAGKLALKLGYRSICRESVFKDLVDGDGPRADLFRAADHDPLALGRMKNGREKYLAYLRQAFLERFEEDNAVYHGFAAHTFLRGVSHAIRVRINPERDQRLAPTRLNWYRYLHGIDLTDPLQYDLVISMNTMTVEEAVEVIAEASRRGCFQPTGDSGNRMRMLCLAARVQALLAEETPFVNVAVEDGDITLSTEGYWKQAMKVMDRVEQILGENRSVGIKVRLKTPRTEKRGAASANMHWLSKDRESFQKAGIML